MGYTHYWHNSKGFNDKQWKLLQDAAHRIFMGAAVKLGNAHGHDSPEISDERIAFNGWEDDGEDYETCAIERRGEEFSFCKTARRPYDTYVVALIDCAERINKDFTWSSDGDDEEVGEGRVLAERTMESLGFPVSMPTPVALDSTAPWS